MIIDRMDAFAALEHYDIRVARSKVVDSAEDAVAFAQRRNATDARLIPIVLCPSDTGRPATAERLTSAEAIRRAYEAYARAAGTAELKIFAQTATAPGTDIVISGEIDEDLGKSIALHSATHLVRRMVPLGAAGAEALALNFAGHNHHGANEQSRRMLEHLLEKVSAFFEGTPVTAFRLDVRLHENGYTVLDASVTAPKAFHLRKRLDARAHDRKGDEFHPAGRQ